MIRGNRRVDGGRGGGGGRNGRLWGGLGGGNLWNGGGRHVAGIFRFGFFLFDKVVTAGKLFYDCAGRNRGEDAEENTMGEMTRTQNLTHCDCRIWILYLYDLKKFFSAEEKRSSATSESMIGWGECEEANL
jgi:hypothetical protein